MTTRDFFLTLFAVAIGGLAAMIAWTLIVKSQVSSSLAANPIGNLFTLFGSKPAGS